MLELHQIAAALYLAAGLGALMGNVLPAPRMRRGAVWGLILGVVVQTLAIASLHGGEATPPLTDLPIAVSLMAWVAICFLLLLMRRVRLPGLVAVVGLAAFLAVFVAALHLGNPATTDRPDAGSIPHAHVLLGSAGLALLGVAGVAGGFFLIEHRQLKAKRSIRRTLSLPSLEALDRVNVAALSVGFPLLSLGVITGMLWQQSNFGSLWTGASHESWTLVAWAIYAGLAMARFAGRQGARQAAASAVVGFAFLLFAVVGVGVLG